MENSKGDDEEKVEIDRELLKQLMVSQEGLSAQE